MTRISLRIASILFVLSLAFGMTSAIAQTASGTPAEKLTKHQLTALIATAKTPAEHERLAKYYEAKAQEYQAQAKEHEAMVAAYKANPTQVTEKSRMATVNHCEYFVKTFNELATKSEELAQTHHEMAMETEKR
ncbi:MAG: hypothetical protein P4K83_09920 [Terracidiphilus sp.]|nr:hypothetical protein [Terracidiphilus sp.]